MMTMTLCINLLRAGCILLLIGGCGSNASSPSPERETAPSDNSTSRGASTNSRGSDGSSTTRPCYDSLGHTPGALDESFATNGVSSLVIGSLGGTAARLSEFLALPDGKFLAAGHTSSARDAFVFVLNADGSLDSDFGKDGRVSFEYGTLGRVPTVVNGAAIDPQGRILIAGTDEKDAVLVRLTGDGTVDPTFGDEGLVTIDQGSFSDSFLKVVPRADGSLVVLGHTSPEAIATPTLTFLDEHGSRNAAVGNDGIIAMHPISSNPTSSNAFAADVVVLEDQSWLLFGHVEDSLFWTTGDTTGALTSTLGKEKHGFVSRAATAEPRGLLPNRDGTLVSWAMYWTGNLVLAGLAAFEPSGEELLRTDMTGVMTRSLALQCDGRIVAAGQRNVVRDIESPGALVRFEANGKVDATFGGLDGLDYWYEAPATGKRQTASFQRVHVQSDGKIVAAGIAGQRVDVVRFWP